MLQSFRPQPLKKKTAEVLSYRRDGENGKRTFVKLVIQSINNHIVGSVHKHQIILSTPNERV